MTTKTCLGRPDRLSTTVAADREPRLVRVLSELASSRCWSARAVRMLSFAVVAVMAIQGVGLAVERLGLPSGYERDFLQLYVLVRAFSARSSLYRPIPDLSDAYLDISTPIFPHPAPHPPTLGMIFLPFAALDYHAAETCWLVLQIACLALALFLLGRFFRSRVTPTAVIGLTVVGLAWRPVAADLQWGNVNVILLAVLTGALLATRRGRPGWAGGLLGLGLLIKPVAWPIVVGMAIRRDWRAFASAIATTAAGLLLTGLLVGFEQITFYATHVLPQVSALYETSAGNISLASVAWHVFRGATSGEPYGVQVMVALPLAASPEAAQLAALALPAATVGACLLLTRRWKSAEWSFALLAALSVEVNPIAWDLYEVLLIIPIALVASWLRDHGFPPFPTIAFALVLVVLIVPSEGWVQLMYVLAGRSAIDVAAPVPPGPGLLLSLPALAVCAFIGLIVRLAERAEP